MFRRQTAKRVLALAIPSLFGSYCLCAQEVPNAAQAPTPGPAKSAWAYNLTIDGYVVPHGTSYIDPVLTANRKWLHLEARYNYENLKTGSLWFGYNFSAGKTLVLNITPMVGGLFGRTDGIAPGCEFSLTYKKIQFAISNEYVFDTTSKSGSFYYTNPEITYSPVTWFRVGAVAQRTKTYHTRLDVQRGFLIGISHKVFEFTTYILNPVIAQPVIELEVGASF